MKVEITFLRYKLLKHQKFAWLYKVNGDILFLLLNASKIY